MCTAIYETNRELYFPKISCSSLTSIDGKGLVVKESPLEGILHLGSVNNVIFGL